MRKLLLVLFLLLGCSGTDPSVAGLAQPIPTVPTVAAIPTPTAVPPPPPTPTLAPATLVVADVRKPYKARPQIVLPVPVPARPEQLVETNPACDIVNVPAWIYDDGGIVVQPSGTPVWVVQEAIWIDGQTRWCDGDRWVRVSNCEGLNAYNHWSETRNNGQGAGHIGAFQVSRVHDADIPGGWPDGISYWQGNIAFAADLRDRSISPDDPDGLSDWRPWSGDCFDL